MREIKKDNFEILMHTHFKVVSKKLSDIGLYKGQPIVLDLIQSNSGATQAEIAKKAGVKPSTLNVTINRLEKNGLVERKYDSKGCVYITDKGEELLQTSKNIIDDVRKIQYKGFSEEELKTLNEYLYRILKNLEEVLN